MISCLISNRLKQTERDKTKQREDHGRKSPIQTDREGKMDR